MKLIKSSYEILPQAPGLEGVYKQIEIGARTCYRSEDAIKDGSAEKMVQFLKERGHNSPLEHGTVYLHVKSSDDIDFQRMMHNYLNNSYSRIIHENALTELYITSNMRVLIENGWEDDLKYLCEPTEFHERRISVRFTNEIALSREENRHRVNSISEESTRYCRYDKDKFGNQITVIQPLEFSDEEIAFKENQYGTDPLIHLCEKVIDGYTVDFSPIDYWFFANLAAEFSYMGLLKCGWKPQQARKVLLLDTKTELMHTAFMSDWQHFFSLRTSSGAHPDIIALMTPLYEEFVEKGYITPIE